MSNQTDRDSSYTTSNENEDLVVFVVSQQTAVSALTQDSSLSKWTTTSKPSKKCPPASSSTLPSLVLACPQM